MVSPQVLRFPTRFPDPDQCFTHLTAFASLVEPRDCSRTPKSSWSLATHCNFCNSPFSKIGFNQAWWSRFVLFPRGEASKAVTTRPLSNQETWSLEFKSVPVHFENLKLASRPITGPTRQGNCPLGRQPRPPYGGGGRSTDGQEEAKTRRLAANGKEAELGGGF